MTYENKHPSFFQRPQGPQEPQTVSKKPLVENFGSTANTAVTPKTTDKILKCSQESSQFSKLFFSPKNIENLQKIIRYEVYRKTEDVIPYQSNTELSIVMKSNYLQYGRVPANLQDYPKRIQELNDRVAHAVVPGIITAVQQYKGYLIDASKAPDFLDRPVNASNTGTKELRSTTSVLFGEKKRF